MIDELFRPFEFEFFRNGLIVATFAGALCGMVGVYVVLKGMSYIGHGLSHSIFGGFAASSLLGVNFVLGAGVWGVASALMINGVTRRRVIGADAAIGVITTASFALGLALFAMFGRSGRSFDAALSAASLVSSEPTSSRSCADAARRWGHLRRLPATAVRHLRSRGRRGVRGAHSPSRCPTHAGAAASILATMQVLGVTLIAATLVIPPTVARMLTNSFPRMLVLAPSSAPPAGSSGCT